MKNVVPVNIKQILALKEICMGANVFAQLFASFPPRQFQQVRDNKFLVEELTRRLSQFEGVDFQEKRFDVIRELYREAERISGKGRLVGRTNQRVVRFLQDAHQIIDKIFWDYWEEVLGLDLPPEVAARRK